MRIKIFSGTLLLLILNVVALFAQSGDPGLPCEGNDVDSGPCPLDTWVIVFAGVVMVFTAIHLYRKRTLVKGV